MKLFTRVLSINKKYTAVSAYFQSALNWGLYNVSDPLADSCHSKTILGIVVTPTKLSQ